MSDKVKKTDEQWAQQLSREQFAVARKKGTERAFTGEYHDHHEKGMYVCVCCGQELFRFSENSIPARDGRASGNPFRRRA